MAVSVAAFNCSCSEQIFQFKIQEAMWSGALKCSSNIVNALLWKLVDHVCNGSNATLGGRAG
jgi:hypothetical protein